MIAHKRAYAFVWTLAVCGSLALMSIAAGINIGLIERVPTP